MTNIQQICLAKTQDSFQIFLKILRFLLLSPNKQTRMIIQARKISKAYGTLSVLNDVNLDVVEGEIVSIVGASGAGKSTLLHILGTLDRPDQGSVRIKAQDTSLLSPNKLSKFRNKEIGFVFQSHHLLPEFNAIENIMMPALISGMSMNAARENANRILQTLGLENRKDHRPSELSGGEQQRIAVGRALINQPAVIFADEPSGNLDSQNARSLHNLFFQLREEYKQTFVIVTHNEELANMADRKLFMRDGRFVD